VPLPGRQPNADRFSDAGGGNAKDARGVRPEVGMGRISRRVEIRTRIVHKMSSSSV
jgi:hypothetical protein